MLTIETTPELETSLQAEAQKRGLSVEQHALEILARNVSPAQPELADEEFEAALDEAVSLFADIPFGTKEWRTLKEEEMALEEAKHQRLFGKGAQ